MRSHRINACKAIAFGFGVVLALNLSGTSPALAGNYAVKNLVTDDKTVNPAGVQDPHLVNAWGISRSDSSPFWISDNGTGVSTLYSVNPASNATGIVPLVVTIPGAGNPTGQVFNTENAGGAFNKNIFLFVSEDGTISGWHGGTTAEVLQLSDAANVYKGTTLDSFGGHAYLLSANFRSGNIDVLKGDNGAPGLPGNFTDPGLTSGYAPFNIQKLGNTIYVTYALQDASKTDDVAGPGNGIVSAFNLDGTFLKRVSTGGMLNSPWGLAIAPTQFGGIAGDLLVGNFGDGHINVIDPVTGSFIGQLDGTNNQPLAIDGLWGLITGNDMGAGSSHSIYFTAGPQEETHGLFGVIQTVPEPSTAVLGLIAMGLVAARWRSLNRRSKSVA